MTQLFLKKHICNANINQRKAGTDILILDTVDFREKKKDLKQ